MDGQKKILIVDDELEMREMLKERLQQDNFNVLLADDGDKAIKVAEQEVPDLIILDILMPNMDGYTCLKEIRRLPKTKDISILILSGKEEEKVRDLFAFQKIKGYIEKPFRLTDLVTKVKEILET